MQSPWPPLLALLAAGAVAALVVTSLGSTSMEEMASPDGVAGRAGVPSATPPPAPPAQPAEPLAQSTEAEVEPADWSARLVEVPPGAGPLSGSDLLAALGAAGSVRVRGASEAELEALRRTQFEVTERGTTVPHSAVLGWLKEAGFVVEVAYPTLIVRRRTDEGWSSPR